MTQKKIRARAARALRHNGLDWAASHKAARLILDALDDDHAGYKVVDALNKGDLTADAISSAVAILSPDRFAYNYAGLVKAGVDADLASTVAGLILVRPCASIADDLLDDAGYLTEYVFGSYWDCTNGYYIVGYGKDRFCYYD